MFLKTFITMLSRTHTETVLSLTNNVSFVNKLCGYTTRQSKGLYYIIQKKLIYSCTYTNINSTNT